MQLDGPVLLYGAGREARSTRAFLKTVSPDTKVYVTVDSGEAEIEDSEALSPEELSSAIAGRRFSLIVKSPGVSRYKPVFAEAEAAGISVTSNLNLWGEAYREGRTVIAITGTKGKSTTATLTHLMLTHSGLDAGLAGNVGLAPLEIVDRHRIVVFELSSYQTADLRFSPDIAGLTNLYPEHVDWHGTVDQYYADKLNLFAGREGIQVALSDQAAALPLVQEALGGGARPIRPLEPLIEDAVTEAVRSSRLKGAHNLDNARLAARLALNAGATLDGVLAGIAAFAPLPHRLEEHRIGGLIFVDDSISTTPEATKAALNAYHGYRIALIAGGHERQQDYHELAGLLAGFGVKTLVCLPITGARLASATRSAAPDIDVVAAPHLLAAMETLRERQKDFDAVILSPGAPSYNQLLNDSVVFKNFEERGTAFIALAHEFFGRTA